MSRAPRELGRPALPDALSSLPRYRLHLPPGLRSCRRSASAVVRAGLRKQPETAGDGLETVGVALEMSGKMRASENALPHTRFGRARPARRSHCSRSCSSSRRRQNLKNRNLIHARRWPCAVRPEPGPIARAERGQDSREGNPDYNPCTHAA